MSAGGTGQTTGQGGDRPARDPAGTAALERRYRRLLRCYPPSHREFHREEMLGVLLAAARPGQRTPGLRGTVNLAACGLAIRVRRIPGWLAADAGQDALAVVSLIAPAVVVILIALAPAPMNVTAAARVPFWTLPPFPPSTLVMTAWLAVVLLGLTGGRAAAVVIAFISVTIAWLAWLALSVQLLGPGPWRLGPGPGGLVQFLGPAGGIPIVLASLAACSLAFSPGPRRGLAIAGWWRACLTIAALSAGFGFPFIVQRVHPAALALTGSLAFRLLGILADVAPPGVTLLVDLLVAVLVWPMAIVSWLGRVGPAARAG